MNDIEKLDSVTWYGRCVIHVMAALNDLPNEAKLIFCQDLHGDCGSSWFAALGQYACSEPPRSTLGSIVLRFLHDRSQAPET